MGDKSRDSELKVVEGLWKMLDDQQLVKDVVMKGKYISNAIKFIANRNGTTVDGAKDLFFNEVSQFVNNLIRNKQLHRASHVLKNVQLNEFYYFFDFYQVRNFLISTNFVFLGFSNLVSIPRMKKMKRSESC